MYFNYDTDLLSLYHLINTKNNVSIFILILT